MQPGLTMAYDEDHPAYKRPDMCKMRATIWVTIKATLTDTTCTLPLSLICTLKPHFLFLHFITKHELPVCAPYLHVSVYIIMVLPYV